MNWFQKNKLAIIGIVAGAIAGYLYYQQIGCTSGSCSITSKPVNSTLYFSIMGGLLFSLFQKNNKSGNPDA